MFEPVEWRVFAGLWLGLPACIEEFDFMIKDFFKASFKEDQQKVVDKAQALADKIKEEPKKTRASVYVKTMQKVRRAMCQYRQICL